MEPRHEKARCRAQCRWSGVAVKEDEGSEALLRTSIRTPYFPGITRSRQFDGIGLSWEMATQQKIHDPAGYTSTEYCALRTSFSTLHWDSTPLPRRQLRPTPASQGIFPDPDIFMMQSGPSSYEGSVLLSPMDSTLTNLWNSRLFRAWSIAVARLGAWSNSDVRPWAVPASLSADGS